MALASGASTAATGSITANTDSTLTLARPSDQVLISNEENAVKAYVRLNGAVSPTVYDFVLAAGERVVVSDVRVETVHVYTNSTTGVRVVAW